MSALKQNTYDAFAILFLVSIPGLPVALIWLAYMALGWGLE